MSRDLTGPRPGILTSRSETAQGPRVMDDVDWSDRVSTTPVIRHLEESLDIHLAKAPAPAAPEAELRAWYAVLRHLQADLEAQRIMAARAPSR